MMFGPGRQNGSWEDEELEDDADVGLNARREKGEYRKKGPGRVREAPR